MGTTMKSDSKASRNSGSLNTVGLVGGPTFGSKYSGNIKSEGGKTPVHPMNKQDGGKVRSNVNDTARPTQKALKPGTSPK